MNILDLEPSEFLSALNELGIVGEQRDALVAQYSDPSRGYERDERPFLTRLGDNVIGFDDGVETQGERIGQGFRTFFDAVRSDPLGTAGGMISGIYGDIERGVRGELSPSETFELAGILTLPTVGARFDPNVARMFGGRGTTNEYADRAMDRAEELRGQGLSPDDIWRKTSEEFPDAPASVMPDGSPFYEMPDAEAFTQRLGLERVQDLATQLRQATDPEDIGALRLELNRIRDAIPAAGVLSTPLQDVLTHPQLYDDFPRVGDIRTQLKASLPASVAGQYYPPPSTATPGVIQVSSRLGNLEASAPADTLIHEVQHGVAGTTGTLPQGTNPNRTRELTSRLEGLTNTYRVNARGESDRLQNRLDDLESEILSRGGAEELQAFREITDPLVGSLTTAVEAASAPYRDLTKALYGPEGVTQGFSGGDPAQAFYYMDPGEALARLSEARRKMSMAERRATTPMESLRRESRPLEFDELVKLQSEYDLRDYLQDRFDIDLTRPSVDGVNYSDYFRALDLTMDELPGIMSETAAKLNMAAGPEARQSIIAQGRNQLRRTLQGKLKGFAE